MQHKVELLMAKDSDFIESVLDRKELLVAACHGIKALCLAKKNPGLCKR